MELICPAGTPSAYREAVEAGADAIYCGFQDQTNARNFPGLNFSRSEMEQSITFGHGLGVQTFVAINTYMTAGGEALWHAAVDDAVQLGADAIILADIGLMAYAAERYPDQRLHVSVQTGASNQEAISYLVQMFGAKRVVLPRVLTLNEVANLSRHAPCETEVFVFGGLCVMAEGRCSLSSYATGQSPNMHGVCSPASHVRYRVDGDELVSELDEYTINRFRQGEPAGYPTLCKGRFNIGESERYAFEDPVSLEILTELDALKNAGVKALKIEGRQRGKAYVARVVSTIRTALNLPSEQRDSVIQELKRMSEGQQTTSGAYVKSWR